MKILDILLFTTNSILPLILLILIGFFLRRKGFFTEEFLKIGNKTVFYVCLPALLFQNIAEIDGLSQIRLDVVGYAAGVIVVLLLLGYLVTFLISDPKQKGVIHQCIFRSNFALIGVPLAELIGGGEGVRVAAVLSLFSIPIYNMAGVVVLSVYGGKGVKLDLRKILKGIVTNPLIIGVFAGLLFALLRMGLGETQLWAMGAKLTFLPAAVKFLSRSATPLALLVLGGQFDFQKISGYGKPLVIGVVGRNIAAPIIGVGIAGVLSKLGVVSFGPEVFAALIALFATPVAVASAVMAEAMDNDGQLASQLVVWTSLVSLVSLFVTIALSRTFGVL